MIHDNITFHFQEVSSSHYLTEVRCGFSWIPGLDYTDVFICMSLNKKHNFFIYCHLCHLMFDFLYLIEDVGRGHNVSLQVRQESDLEAAKFKDTCKKWKWMKVNRPLDLEDGGPLAGEARDRERLLKRNWK